MFDAIAQTTQQTAAPTGQVAAEKIAGTAAAHDMSFIGLFMQADIVVKSIMLGLLLASFYSWAIIFDKWFKIKMLKRKTDQFEEQFWSGTLLEQLYDRVKAVADFPMVMVFCAAMHEWKRQDSKQTSSDSTLKANVKERIFQAMNVARNRSIDALERKMSFLATVGSTAPFIGLFGTVWGIMRSFQSIAATKSTSLSVVAPGIAEALFATAIGLFAAIPAVIFYNKFSSDLNKISNQVDDFSTEFASIISRELDK